MKVKVLTRFNRQDEGSKLGINTAQNFNKAMMLGFSTSGISREDQTGVYMHFMWSH